MLFPRLVDNFLVILRLKNDLIDRGQWLFNSFAMIQSRPRRYDQVFIFRTFISFFFTQNKQPNQCFTVGHRTPNSSETQKLSTEKLWLVIHLSRGTIIKVYRGLLTAISLRDLRSTFINITGARYQRSHQGEWQLRIDDLDLLSLPLFFDSVCLHIKSLLN